jgi:CRP-like cAMP-binding protein
MLPVPPVASANKLLATLPQVDRQRIASYLTSVPVAFRQVIYEQDEEIRDVYFPGSGAWSLTKTMEQGGTAEVATVGNEGMIGSSVFFGDPIAYRSDYPSWWRRARVQNACCCLQGRNGEARRIS